MKIKNIDMVAERIKLAVQNGERIILYGDSDLDGVASVVIVEEAIKNIGGEVELTMFPDREGDGYGLNFKALELLRGKTPALFITLDLGISNVQEVKAANEMGFSVVVIDHHEPHEQLPSAEIIVDPKQPGDQYPFKNFCNAGLAFKLAEELLGRGFSTNVRNSFLELAALATISDMVAREQDNVQILEEGLRSLPATFRPGLRVFLDIIGEGEVAEGGYHKIISALNAAESAEFKNISYELLTASDPRQCRELADTLLGKVIYKQQRIQEIVAEVERRISQKPRQAIIFEGDPAWRSILAGPVASLIAQRHEKPTFIFKLGTTESVGSVRSLKEGENSVEAMKSCQHLLVTYGGHPKASGFRLKNEHLDAFKNCLVEYFRK